MAPPTPLLMTALKYTRKLAGFAYLLLTKKQHEVCIRLLLLRSHATKSHGAGHSFEPFLTRDLHIPVWNKFLHFSLNWCIGIFSVIISLSFCFQPRFRPAAIKDIPPGNSKCRFMRSRTKHCFVYHCKELVPQNEYLTIFYKSIGLA